MSDQSNGLRDALDSLSKTLNTANRELSTDPEALAVAMKAVSDTAEIKAADEAAGKKNIFRDKDGAKSLARVIAFFGFLLGALVVLIGIAIILWVVWCPKAFSDLTNALMSIASSVETVANAANSDTDKIKTLTDAVRASTDASKNVTDVIGAAKELIKLGLGVFSAAGITKVGSGIAESVASKKKRN